MTVRIEDILRECEVAEEHGGYVLLSIPPEEIGCPCGELVCTEVIGGKAVRFYRYSPRVLLECLTKKTKEVPA